MECSVCELRSGVSSCVRCHVLLCEECGIACDHCSSSVCPEHSYTTRKGRTLCVSCAEERKQRKKQQRAAIAAGEMDEDVPVEMLRAAVEGAGIKVVDA